jgi:hypothetical protein
MFIQYVSKAIDLASLSLLQTLPSVRSTAKND